MLPSYSPRKYAWPPFDLSRSKQMSPNERPYMTSYPSLIIHLGESARVSKVRPFEICLTSIWPLQVKDNGAKWNLIYDFLSIIYSRAVVILNRFGDIGHWKLAWPGLTFQGHSRPKTIALNETSYMTSYPWPIVTLWLSWIDLEI